MVAEAYVHELTRKGAGTRGVYWLNDEPRVAALEWPLIGAGLDEIEYARFLRPVNWSARINEISTELSGSDAMLAIDSWTRRARFHLRVLLSLHAAITSKLDEPRLASLESTIGELLIVRDPLPTGEGTLGLFRDWHSDDKSSSSDDDLPGLLVDELWRFAPDRRVEMVARWASTTESLAELLAIAAVLDLPRELRIIQDRLTEFDVDDFIARQHWFTRLEKMAQDAAVAKQRDISRKILDYGDRASHGHAYGENWRKSAFRTRLILAYEESDLGILDTLVPGPPPNDKLTDEMRRSREFYRGLLLLKIDPVKAVNIFTELVNKNPLELSSRLNLIAAHLESARILPNQHDRRAAALAQLDEIERLEQDLPPAAIPRWRNNLSYNRLDSCDLAEDDSRFDQFWAALAVRERHSISFLKLLHRNSQRRGNSRVFDAAWNAALPHFANADGSMLPEFVSMREEQAAERTATPPGVEVFSFPPNDVRTPNSEIPKLPPQTPPRQAHRFLPGRPWSDRESLPGREEELARLGELVLMRRPVVVLGQRRAGKTSLLRHLGRRLADEREVYYFALEGHRIRSKDDLALALSPEIIKDKEGVARATLVDPKISKRVYLIDELAHLGESDQTVFGWLRQLWHVSGGIVLAGTPWDWWRVHQHAARVVPGSSFGNDLTPEELGPLTYPNALHFLVANRGEDSNLDEEAALRIIKRCGTWPYYLNVMGEAVLRVGGKIDEEVVDRAYQARLLRGAGAVFSSRWAELPQPISKLLRDHRGMRPDFRQLSSLHRVQLLDAGLCNLAGEWLDDKPFFDWIEQYAFEEEL